MKYDKHQQQITNKLIICITETKKTKPSMYRAVTSQNQKLIKFLKFFVFDSANYSFYLLCIMALILMKKVFLIF